MTADPSTEPVDYPHCGFGADADDLVGCKGRRVPRPPSDEVEAEQELHEACLAHLDESDRSAYLTSLRPGSDLADHSGTTFSPGLLGELLNAVRDPADGRSKFGWVRFHGATFEDGPVFHWATFKSPVGFVGATFEGIAWFSGAVFEDNVAFSGATFKGPASFSETTFGGRALFGEASFAPPARSARAPLFEGAAHWFGGQTSEESVLFAGATFEDTAWFGGATFKGDAQFDGTAFEGNAEFAETVFETASRLGPLACKGLVNLTKATFQSAVTVEVAAKNVDCRRTHWASHATLRLRHAEVDLSDVVLEFPLSVVHAPFSVHLGPDETRYLAELGLSEGLVGVTSLSGADASHIVLSDIDLRECSFAGTVNLDQLRLHGQCALEPAPSGLRRSGLRPVRWTSRQTLAEERTWRAANGHPGWAAHPEAEPPLEPAALAPIYRDLRKSFEDAKNEPGAADFYYGEMEMRRHNRDAPAAERALLWLYWAVSGYGLRASRALGWLLAAMTVTVLLMVGFGLPDTPAEPYPRTAGVIGKQNPTLRAGFADRFTTARTRKAVDVVVNSVVFRSSGQSLTTAGRYTEMASRFTEPILLALALLAVRGRVKR